MKRIILVTSLFLSIGIILLHNCISVNALSFENTENFKLDDFEFIPVSESGNYLKSTNNIDGYLIMWNTYIPVRFANAYTPNNTPVSVYEILGDIDSNMIDQGNEYFDNQYPNANRKSSATAYYNCHSYAWYMNSNTNTYWMNYPTNYYIIEDHSYVEVINPQVGDIICYFDDNETPYNMDDDENLHSGIVYELLSGTSNDICGNANLVMVESKWGPAGLYEHRGDECPYTSYTNGEADYVKYYRPNTNNKYALSNYSSVINTSKSINGTSENIIDKYAMYELNVTYNKNYEIFVTSTNKLDVRLYDKQMQLLEIDDLNIDNNIDHVIKNLSIGTYYLRVAYEDTSKSGTINTKITSRNTQYLLYNQENDILINYYNNINSYYYINSRGPGSYKINLTATKADGTSVIYPSSAIIVNDHMDMDREYKYDVLGYSELAENDSGLNSFYMYLPRNGYFYIHIDMPDADYSSMTLSITPADYVTIDMLDRMDSEFSEEIFDNAEIGDYAKAITINQTGNFTINFSTIDNINEDITLILFKQEYNSTTGSYEKIDIYAKYMNNSNKTRSVTRTLDSGIYYIGYFNNLSGANINATLTRILQNNSNRTTAMVADPGLGFNYGSEVRFNNGQFGNHSITEGFTRYLYFIPETGTLPSNIRQDYDWYSSNPDIATVSPFGTVFAKEVSSNTTVTIYAVYRADASIIYSRTFNILRDTSSELIEIEFDLTYSYFVENGSFQIELNETNCPYPWIQYYTWTVFVPDQENDIMVSIGQWGHITATGPGYAELTGHYTINPRVYIKINLTITE